MGSGWKLGAGSEGILARSGTAQPRALAVRLAQQV